MLFSERIKELRMQYKLPQRHLAAALDIEHCDLLQDRKRRKES